MAERLYRTQILLEPEQHKVLAEMADREGRSISDLVRELIREQLQARKSGMDAGARRRIEALARIRRHREEIIQRRGGKALEIDVVEMVRRTQEEQDERNLAWLIGSGD